MPHAPGDILVLKQGTTYAWQRRFVTLLADGTVTVVNLTDTPVTLTMTHLLSGSTVIAGASAIVTNGAAGEAEFVFSSAQVARIGMHQCLWDVGGTAYPFEGFDLVEVEERR